MNNFSFYPVRFGRQKEMSCSLAHARTHTHTQTHKHIPLPLTMPTSLTMQNAIHRSHARPLTPETFAWTQPIEFWHSNVVKLSLSPALPLSWVEYAHTNIRTYTRAGACKALFVQLAASLNSISACVEWLSRRVCVFVIEWLSNCRLQLEANYNCLIWHFLQQQQQQFQ